MQETRKQVCKCEHCGSEAEMVITCTLPDEDSRNDKSAAGKEMEKKDQKVKGTAVCSHCGNEADMWIDL